MDSVKSIEPKTVRFFVSGEPKAQPRARLTSRYGNPHAYNPSSSKYWKMLIIQNYKSNYFFTTPVICNTTFIFKRPQRLMKKNSNPLRIPYGVKPDRDNLDKAVLDALTKAKAWKDDSLAFDGRIQKFYAAIGEETGCHIEIIEVPNVS